MYEYIYQCVYFDLRCYYIFICWEIKYEKQTHKSLVYVRDAMQVLRSVSFSVSKVLVHFLQNTCLQFGCSCHCSFFKSLGRTIKSYTGTCVCIELFTYWIVSYWSIASLCFQNILMLLLNYETFDDQNIYPQYFTVSVIMWYIIHVYDKYDTVWLYELLKGSVIRPK